MAILTAFWLLFAIPSYASQEYTKPKAAQAISNGSVYSICQDGFGAVWMNTNYGLCRYNGNRLDFIYNRLPRGRVICDNAGNMFVPAFDGILKICSQTGEHIKLRGEGLTYKESVVLSSNGKLLVGSTSRIYVSEGADTLLLACSLPEGEHISDLIRYPGGIILAAASSGRIFDVSEFDSPICVYSAGDGISCLFADSHKRLWVGLENEGVRVLGSSFYPLKSYFMAGTRPIRNARTFCEDGSGNVYIGSLDGLSVVTASGDCFDSEEYSPAGHAVCQVMTDRDGNVWIGTFYDGVFLCEADNSPFRAIHNPDLRLINAMVEDRSGCVWVFTDHYGLWKYSDKSGFRLVPGTRDRKFKSAWYDTRLDIIWAGEYFSKLDRIDPVSGRWEEFPCESAVFDIAARRGEMYLATASGVYTFDPSSEKAVTRRIEGCTGQVWSLLFDAAGSLWIAGNNLMRLSSTFGFENIAPGCRCFYLSCSPDGGICAGTSGKGAWLYKHGERTVFDKAGTGLQDDYVYLVEEISGGVLLLGTNMGLSLLDMKTSICCNFNSGNGLRLNSAREGDVLHRSNGEIWIGGVDGLVSLDRKRMSFPLERNPICFDMMFVGGKVFGTPGSLCGKESIRLPAGKQSGVTLELSDFNFSCILPSSYEYRVGGPDSVWTPLDPQQRISFPELRPGRYAVEVRSALSGGPGTSRLELIVPRKWYCTVWAIAGYALLLLGGGAAVTLRVRARRLRLRQEEDRRRVVDSVIGMTVGLHTPRTRTRKDSDFLLDVASVIEKHLCDEDMGVELLCREMHISRTMLDRRIKSITGDSPRAFIEEIRLTQAARLMRESDLNVSEIAYEMGYSSPKYFGIRFKNKYGMSPLAYRKMK